MPVDLLSHVKARLAVVRSEARGRRLREQPPALGTTTGLRARQTRRPRRGRPAAIQEAVSCDWIE